MKALQGQGKWLISAHHGKNTGIIKIAKLLIINFLAIRSVGITDLAAKKPYTTNLKCTKSINNCISAI